MKHDQLLSHLTRLVEGFKSGDTCEGRIAFVMRGPGEWDVTAVYRVGNRDGKGGVVLLEDFGPSAGAVAVKRAVDEPQPEEP